MTVNVNKKYILILLILLGAGVFVSFYLFALNKNQENQPTGEKLKITVFYSPNCSCCQEYLTYLSAQGFQVEKKETRDMLSVKEKYQIPSEMESCHTAIIGNYFFEGHIPVAAIKKLLEEKPNIKGIALPGMPEGAPGMGGYKAEALKIYSVLKDSNVSEFGKY